MSSIMFMTQSVSGATGFIFEQDSSTGRYFYVAAIWVFILGATISSVLYFKYKGETDFLFHFSFALTLIISVSLIVIGVTKEPVESLSKDIISKIELKYDVKISNADDFNVRMLDSNSEISKKVRFSTVDGFDYKDGLVSIRAKSEHKYQIVLLVDKKNNNKAALVEYDAKAAK